MADRSSNKNVREARAKARVEEAVSRANDDGLMRPASTEEALRESEERYRRIVETTEEGVWIIDADNKTSFVNNKMAQMLGYTVEEMMGKVNYEFMDERSRAIADRNVARRRKGIKEQHDFRYRRKDGRDLWAIVNASPIFDQAGCYAGALAMVTDITQRKQAEENLSKARDELEQRVQERTATLSKTISALREQIRERQKAEIQLRNSQDQLRALSVHLLSIQEQERRRIAREIHDELGQALTALKIDSVWLKSRLSADQQPLRKSTESMIDLIDTTILTVRRISTELRPRVLDDLGLVAAMQWHVQEFQKRTRIECDLTITPQDIQLEPEGSTTVFRILQESLTNVARHANAGKVGIYLRKKKEWLHLAVRDNGRGITEQELSDPKSLGLIGMRERVLPFGGKVQVRGRAGKGTVIKVRIPVSTESAAAWHR